MDPKSKNITTDCRPNSLERKVRREFDIPRHGWIQFVTAKHHGECCAERKGRADQWFRAARRPIIARAVGESKVGP